MTMRMLIDARHREETRVAVVKGNRIEEFDFESAERKQLKGNIYLAKVTRVEPSLQAAFVEYGGNRHGFLAFAEIHPDYYQIPAADRRALIEEEREAAEAAEAEEDARERRQRSRSRASTPPSRPWSSSPAIRPATRVPWASQSNSASGASGVTKSPPATSWSGWHPAPRCPGRHP